jgi:IS5 family transposase
MEQPQAQKRLKQRKAMVEPVFSHFRLRQNFNRFRRTGLSRVKVEFALQAMAYNISRVIARC